MINLGQILLQEELNQKVRGTRSQGQSLLQALPITLGLVGEKRLPALYRSGQYLFTISKKANGLI